MCNKHVKDIDKNIMLSVIIPVYNAAKYLDECIRSVVSQTYNKLEIILVDDGSTDTSGEICDAWENKDDRIKVIHIKNAGVSHARNVGIELSTGRYLTFVDSDDWIEKDMYHCMMQTIQCMDSELCIGGLVEDYPGKTINNSNILEEERISLKREDIIKTMFSVEHKKLFSWYLVDKIFSRRVIQEVRLNESISYGEDMLFMWQVLKNISNGIYIPLFKYHYRMHSASATHIKMNKNMLSEFRAMDEIVKDISTETAEIQSAIKMLHLRKKILAIRLMIKVNPAEYKEQICHFQKDIRNNWRILLLKKGISFMARLGIIYCCLPFKVCLIGKILI